MDQTGGQGQGSLKGSWANPNGETDIIKLARKNKPEAAISPALEL